MYNLTLEVIGTREEANKLKKFALSTEGPMKIVFERKGKNGQIETYTVDTKCCAVLKADSEKDSSLGAHGDISLLMHD